MKNEKKSIITVNEIREAAQTMQRYKNGKAMLEQKIVEDELFWKRQHWMHKRSGENDKDDEDIPASAWMFNAIINRHADAMDNYPEAVMLPREESDEKSAEALSSVIPIIFEQNGFRGTYSNVWWYKLKHGCGAYGIFWNGRADEGKGQVEIKKLDLLNIFWEPGITDIQKSRNLFICDLVPIDALKESYPEVEIKGNESGELTKYVFDENIDTSDKALVVDWYYKKGEKLHYCKYCEENVLFASENEEGYENGWYEDGDYPVIFDVLYPEEGTPTGFGVISVTREPQMYIDKLDASILKNTYLSSNPRYFAKEDMGINEKEFLDVKNAIVKVSGSIDEEKLQPIKVPEISSAVFSYRSAKINELKETSGNTDFAQGNTAKGVTSGAAIATLQEAGNKLSRDVIEASHEVFKRIVNMVIERIRQFYDIKRVYRITAPNNSYEYTDFDNSGLKLQPSGEVGEQKLFRKPVFDIAVHAQRKNPFSTLSQNETAMNLFKAGIFNPEMAQQALMMLKLMTFEGKEEVVKYVQEGQTLQNQLIQAQQQNEQLMQQLQMLRDGITHGMPQPAIPPQMNAI